MLSLLTVLASQFKYHPVAESSSVRLKTSTFVMCTNTSLQLGQEMFGVSMVVVMVVDIIDLSYSRDH